MIAVDFFKKQMIIEMLKRYYSDAIIVDDGNEV